VQIPEESAESMLENLGGTRGPPQMIRLILSIEQGPEERIESRDMIHVKMGKADVVQLLEFAEGNGVETTFTTVEQQPAHTLPRIHADQQGIVVARSPQDLVLKTHRIGLLFKKWSERKRQNMSRQSPRSREVM
jgi:hypothetical protein